MIINKAHWIAEGDNLRFSMPIGKVDQERRTVSGFATLDNVDKFLNTKQDNLQLSVSHTVSAYNIFYLDEFFTWCYSIGLPKPWLGRVHTPVHMRPTVWKDKKFIIEHLAKSKHPDIKNYIWKLEEWIIRSLSHFGVTGERREGRV